MTYKIFLASILLIINVLLIKNILHGQVISNGTLYFRGLATKESYADKNGWCDINIYFEAFFYNGNATFSFGDGGNPGGLIPGDYEVLFSDDYRYFFKGNFRYRGNGLIQTIRLIDFYNYTNYQSVTFFPECYPSPTSVTTLPTTPYFNPLTSNAETFLLFNSRNDPKYEVKLNRFAQVPTNCLISGSAPFICQLQLYNQYTGLYKLTFNIKSIESDLYFKPFNVSIGIVGSANFILTNLTIPSFILNPGPIISSQFNYYPNNNNYPITNIFTSFKVSNLKQQLGFMGTNYISKSLDVMGQSLTTNSYPLVGNLNNAIFYSKSTYFKSLNYIYHSQINSTGFLDYKLLSNQSYPDFDFTNYLDSMKINSTVESIDSYLSLKFKIDNVLKPSFNINFNKGPWISPLPSLPYGISGGTYSNSTFSVNYYTPSFIKNSSISSEYSYTLNPNQIKSSPIEITTASDIKPPYLTRFEYIPFSTYSFIVKASFIDLESGFNNIVVAPDCILTISDLTNGTINNGTLEKECYFLMLTPDTVTISDLAGNSQSFPLYTPYYFDPFILPNSSFIIGEIPYQMNITINEITTIKFEKSSVDTSNGPISNTLFLNFTTADISFKPRLALIFDQSDYQKLSISNTFEGQWDFYTHQYIIPFTIPARLFTSYLQYTIVSNLGPITWQHLYSKFGDSSMVNVTSANADMLPPLITKIVPAEIQNSISWIITITDEINGFKSGYINYTTDLYQVPISVPITPTSNQGVYMANIGSINYQSCITQTYEIVGILLADNNGYLSITSDSNFYDPLMTVLGDSQNCVLKQTIVCTNTRDTQAPMLNTLSIPTAPINVRGIDRNLTIDFSTKDMYPGISQVTPTIYISAQNGHVVSFKSKETSRLNNVVYYSCNIDIPYGFGIGMDYLYVSIYGIMDSHFNLIGYSSSDLSENQFQSKIPIISSNTNYPIIQTASTFHSYGEKLTLSGKNFASDNLYAVVTPTDGSTVYTYNTQIKSGIKAIFNLPAYYYPFKIQIFNPLPSNIYLITPIIPNQPNITCSNENCMHGTCKDSKCECFPNYSGDDCSYLNNNSTKPEGNSTNPTTNPSSGTTKSLITLYSIREIDSMQNTVIEYFIEKWNFTNSTNDEENYFLYTGVLPTKTIVNVTIQYFLKDKVIFFAGQQIKLSPGSTKFSISLDSYPFQQQLNSLQVLMSAQLSDHQDDKCSAPDKQTKVDGNENLSQIKLIVNDKVLYGSFNPFGVVDGRVIKVKNEILSNVTTSDQKTIGTLIATTIPSYRESIELDPNWSILIDPDKSTQSCGDSGLTTTQKVGIILGSVGFFLVVVCSTAIYFIRKRQSEKRKIELNKRVSLSMMPA